MDAVSIVRSMVFWVGYTSLVLPVYLVLKLGVYELLLLYVPILTFWTSFIYSQMGTSSQGEV